MLVQLRRELHADPETGNQLPRTQQRVLTALAGLPLEITLGTELSSVVAVLRGGRPGPTVLLRGDMDGLPVREQTGLEYASTTGTMHACGHDLHTAGLVGAAHLLAARKEDLAGNVIFMFQPGEENPGGAAPMIAEGLLEAAGEKPVAAYAIHVMPGPAGVFNTRSGAIMAGSNQLHVTFTGEGGHSSRPEMANNPIPATLEFASALHALVHQRISVFDPVVATVTQLDAGQAVNVIPDSATMGASVRTLSHESTKTFGEEVHRLAQGIAAAHKVDVDVDWDVHYPVTINDPQETELVLSTLRDAFGADRVETLEQPHMGSEDFSFVLNEVPGTFIFLCASPPDVDPETAAYNHSPLVMFDDAVLADQAAALAAVAFNRLQA